FFQAEDGIRGGHVTGVQTCALPILKDIIISSGRLTSTAGGSYDGKTVTLSKPLDLSIQNLGLKNAGVEVLSNENINAKASGAVKIGRASCRERVDVAGRRMGAVRKG